MIACIINFSSEPRTRLPDRAATEGVWKEILNTDAEVYDGTGSDRQPRTGRSLIQCPRTATWRPHQSPFPRLLRCGCGSSPSSMRSKRSSPRGHPRGHRSGEGGLTECHQETTH